MSSLCCHNVEFKAKHGAPPDFVTLDADGQVVERIDMTKLNQEGCRKLILKKGFYKMLAADGTVPEEFKNGPYTERTDEEVEKIIEEMKKAEEERRSTEEARIEL